jgi:DNA-binding response OmpR family regulator
MSPCIAVIDDDAACRELLHELLSEEGYAVHLFPDSATAARCLRDLAPAAIPRRSFWTCAWRPPRPAGRSWQTSGTIPCSTATPVLVCSADRSGLQERADLERQGCTIPTKPFDVEELLVLLLQLARGAPRRRPLPAS